MQAKQVAGEKIETVPGNLKKNHKIPVHEQHLVHALVESETWDQGKKTSKPIKQSFYPNDFDRMEKEGHFKGKTVTLIHHPNEGSAKPEKPGKGNNTPPTDDELLEQARAKYKELYNEDANEEANIDDLNEAIQSKIDEDK